MEYVVSHATGPLRGVLRVPGDKSVSHRAVILGAMAEGVTRIDGLLASEDVGATVTAVRALGAEVVEGDGQVIVTGWGERGPREPDAPIDCGNSGTTVRLLAGVVAGWPVSVTFTGDESLSSRPMGRVAAPLSEMGARIETTGGTLPMTVHGGDLVPIQYVTPVASAQVKTLVLLAGMRAQGRTSVTEPAASRDHTERMLPEFEVEVTRSPDMLTASVCGPTVPIGHDVLVPGDPSSAAFFAAAASVIPGSSVRLDHLMLNPTRTGALDVLARMGAAQAFDHRGTASGESVGNVSIRAAETISGVIVGSQVVPALIDEIPVLAVAATQADGVSRFEGVGELRVKESDRLEAIGEALTRLGAVVRWGEDWLEIEGPSGLRGGSLDAQGDHRLAMAYHVAGLITDTPVRISGYDAVSVSYPGFARDMERIAGVSGPTGGKET